MQLDVLDCLMEFFIDIVLSFADLNLGSVQHVHHFDVGRVYCLLELIALLVDLLQHTRCSHCFDLVTCREQVLSFLKGQIQVDLS